MWHPPVLRCVILKKLSQMPIRSFHQCKRYFGLFDANQVFQKLAVCKMRLRDETKTEDIDPKSKRVLKRSDGDSGVVCAPEHRPTGAATSVAAAVSELTCALPRMLPAVRE